MGLSIKLSPLFHLEDLREMNPIELFIQKKMEKVNPDLLENISKDDVPSYPVRGVDYHQGFKRGRPK